MSQYILCIDQLIKSTSKKCQMFEEQATCTFLGAKCFGSIFTEFLQDEEAYKKKWVDLREHACLVNKSMHIKYGLYDSIQLFFLSTKSFSSMRSK